MLTLFRERYEVLATRRRRRRGADRQGAGPPARPLRRAEDPPGARRGRARGPARRGARAAGAAAASGAAARARGLLRPRRLRRRDGLGRRHRPRDAARRARAARARAVERARLSRPGGRGAHAPALAVAAGDPRRRQARQPDPHQGRPDQARRLRPLVRARRARACAPARPATARPSSPPAAFRRARATSTRSRRPRSRCSRGSAPAGVLPDVGGHRPGAGASSSRPRSGSGWRPIRRAGRRRPASWSSACAPAGRRRCRPAS